MVSTGYKGPLHILFIGNSYTHTHNLPGMFANLSESGGHPVDVAAVAKSGWTLQDHLKAVRTKKMIAARNWDFVILQEQSVIPSVRSERNQRMYPAARSLKRRIERRGAAPVFFMTWGRRDGLPEVGCQDFLTMQMQLYYGYLSIARELGAMVAPVGFAWEEALARDPRLDLWDPDGTHPSCKGTYLAACVFYTVLYHQSSEGVSYTAGLSERAARALQRVAAEAVLQSPRCWNIH
jgi:hypothetical protein